MPLTVLMKKSSPKISIIIPCYNYGAYIGEAIESVVSSQIDDFEIIVVNDGSTHKKTIKVLRNIKHPKIKVINQRNSGLATARNNGIARSKGKYICCLDADDKIEQSYLIKCINILEKNHKVGFAYSWVRLFGNKNKIWKCPDYNFYRLLYRNPIPVSAVFRKECWIKTGGYNRNMAVGFEDWDFWLSISENGWKGKLIKEPLFYHRKHGATMTNRARKKYAILYNQIKANHPALFQKEKIAFLKRHSKMSYFEIFRTLFGNWYRRTINS